MDVRTLRQAARSLWRTGGRRLVRAALVMATALGLAGATTGMASADDQSRPNVGPPQPNIVTAALYDVRPGLVIGRGQIGRAHV